MTLVAHASISVLCGAAIAKHKNTKLNFPDFLLFAFFGLLPDLPLSVWILLGQFTPETHHHEWVTHTPLFWFICFLLLQFKYKKLSTMLLVGTWSHLASDWYGGGDGIMFFWPVDNTQYGVLLSGVHGKPAFEHYFSYIPFLIFEILLWIYLVLQARSSWKTAQK